MKILVTGATGFLGRALSRRLEQMGSEIVAVNTRTCDLTVQGALEQFAGQSFDQIYHLAAWTQAGDFCLYHSGEQWIINQQINTNVLAWWKRHQPQAKMICMGTSCAYDPELALTEENYLKGRPVSSLFTYAMTKRMLYAGLLSLNEQFGLEYLCVVPSTLYGPDYHTDGRQMHFIFDLIRKIVNGKKTGENVILWGDGSQRRELVYIDDFINILIHFSGSSTNQLINIGAGIDYEIREFSNAICEMVGYNSMDVKYDTSRYVGAKAKLLNTSKMNEFLPNPYEFVPLEYGIEKVINWYSDSI